MFCLEVIILCVVYMMEQNNRSIDGLINDMHFDDFEAGVSGNYNRNVRYVPPTKWGIRFDNENGNLSVADFIETVERKAGLYRVSRYELYECFSELLGGNPLIWYRAFKDRFVSWLTLKEEFLQQFTKADNDYLIERQLQSRLQQPGESFGIYYACMELLFKKLRRRKTEEMKLEYLIRNLDDFYLNRIPEGQIETIAELGQFCEGLEKSREILRRRRMSQFPLAEPSLQGKINVPKSRVNEVHFDGPASGFPQFPQSSNDHFEAYGGAQFKDPRDASLFQNRHDTSRSPLQSQVAANWAVSAQPSAAGYCANHANTRSEIYNFDGPHCSQVDRQASSQQWRAQPTELVHCFQNLNTPNNHVCCAQGRIDNADVVARNNPNTSMQVASQYNAVNCEFVPSQAQQCPVTMPVAVVEDEPDVAQLSQTMVDCFAIREFAGKCFNCKNTGHHWRNCQQPKKFFCHRCGLEGKSMQSCPNCTGNRPAGSRQ